MSEKEGFGKRIYKWIKGIIDPREYESKLQYVFMLIFIGLVLLMGGMYLYTLLGYVSFIPIGDTEFLTTIVVLFFLIPMTQFWFFAIPLFLGFMALQALVLAIPSELVMLTAGMLWLPAGGTVMNILGGMIAALLLFALSRRGGRPFAIKSVGENNFNVIDGVISKYGIWAVLVGRLVPFIPLDLISIVSGVVDIKWRDYIIGTLIGVAFRAFFYALIGWLILVASGVNNPFMLLQMLQTNPGMFEAQIEAMSLPFNLILTATLLLVAIAFVPYFIWMRHKSKKLES